jgi:DNA polymerase-3 subunit epsilon
VSVPGIQTSFDELGTPLASTTFVVVDLETTGGSAQHDAITEIGAVRVRGGEVLGEFQTLVRPTGAIPPFIAVLTGITDAMVAGAPGPRSVLPSFLEFARGATLVAHNAPFDIGFLRRGTERLGLGWPAFPVVDTVRLARRVLTRDEAPNCKLATLARLFSTSTEPCHRALADARATVDVLHHLLERVGNLGVHTLEELTSYSTRVPDHVRRKRHLADGLPLGPGVYVFRDAQGRPLYVGKSNHVRSRVRSYFTSAETRRRMTEMVALAERVDAVPCATDLEAEVRELRLIAAEQPQYNRRSRRQHSGLWLTLTQEPFPRLSLIRSPRTDGSLQLGPFGSRSAAEVIRTAVHDALPLRQCTTRIPLRPRRTGHHACALAEIGRCGAPCDGDETVEGYAVHVDVFATAVRADPRQLTAALHGRMMRLAEDERYEEAAVQRDRLRELLRALTKVQRLTVFTTIPELVAARRRAGGWDLVVVRHGRLAASHHAPAGTNPYPYVDAAVATAETVFPTAGRAPAASTEESECVLRWLASDGVRLVRLAGVWASPAYGAGGVLAGLVD